MNSRIVITGVGVVSPVGNTLEEVFCALEAGTQGIGAIRSFDSVAYPSPLGAEVKGQEPNNVQRHPAGVDRKEHFLRLALDQLSNNAAFYKTEPDKRQFSLGVGLDYFDLPGYVESAAANEENWLPYSRNTLTMACKIARDFEMTGEVNVNVTACVASSQALGYAFRRLKQLPTDTLMVCGGVDSMLNPLHYMGFHKLGALSTWDGNPHQACRPFDLNRRGLVLGEGAALFTLQRVDSVQTGQVLAEIAGYAATMDAYMVTDPDPSGTLLAKAAFKALDQAGISPDEVDCLHLHGTGTLKNDPAEAAAVRLIFPERFREIPVFSMKGQVGHLIAGCGAMEMIGVLYSLHTQSVPPTVNFQVPDPNVPLNVTTGRPLMMRIRNVLKLNAAFGGQNTALVVRKYEP